jgi:hypothetical protein
MARSRKSFQACLVDRPSESSSLLAGTAGGGHVAAMQHRSTAAGGIFLFLGLLMGAVYGINAGQPMLWLLRGFAAGAVLAILVWVVDRSRS